jgi:hypothetical protein
MFHETTQCYHSQVQHATLVACCELLRIPSYCGCLDSMKPGHASAESISCSCSNAASILPILEIRHYLQHGGQLSTALGPRYEVHTSSRTLSAALHQLQPKLQQVFGVRAICISFDRQHTILQPTPTPLFQQLVPAGEGKNCNSQAFCIQAPSGSKAGGGWQPTSHNPVNAAHPGRPKVMPH